MQSSLPGQKLRLGGDALGADPTYLLYLAYRSRGELQRIDLGPDCAGATLSDFAASELARKPLLHSRGISLGWVKKGALVHTICSSELAAALGQP